MAKATKKETWHTLVWKDDAGREDQMVGPLSALEAQVKHLKEKKVDYTLEEFGWQEAVVEEVEVKGHSTKQVAGKELEVRDEA